MANLIDLPSLPLACVS